MICHEDPQGKCKDLLEIPGKKTGFYYIIYERTATYTSYLSAYTSWQPLNPQVADQDSGGTQ
jgi:hypothetical protein